MLFTTVGLHYPQCSMSLSDITFVILHATFSGTCSILLSSLILFAYYRFWIFQEGRRSRFNLKIFFTSKLKIEQSIIICIKQVWRRSLEIHSLEIMLIISESQAGNEITALNLSHQIYLLDLFGCGCGSVTHLLCGLLCFICFLAALLVGSFRLQEEKENRNHMKH